MRKISIATSAIGTDTHAHARPRVRVRIASATEPRDYCDQDWQSAGHLSVRLAGSGPKNREEKEEKSCSVV